MISTVNDLMAEALFASDLQPSQNAAAGAVHEAVSAALLRHGAEGCLAIVAGEFGDRPESAVARMGWARETVAVVASELASATA
ncbi:hypothetical protein [Pilimelia columellifera]|uniref:Pyrroline-5-carboxylate reductase n=1 Tax=Pilimelia columellifera subsp. columellifera TaxID=706583 RepID=A0ABN3N705_9ACTN